ncbi:hypothetical protein DRP53_08945 [candidate division WOR-3 bacterium]|uniref:Uncharacterized protein n=1 Tax=candidate division WOR-3 bacterium TaxID=2052148 RepID=A0A660SF84_UNCW3|nr:MAG: hypothetical protein DRP53_08945 [candidate division WOR-3 bacterium]
MGKEERQQLLRIRNLHECHLFTRKSGLNPKSLTQDKEVSMRKWVISVLMVIVGCFSMSQNLKRYSADSAFSPNFDLSRDYRVAVLPAVTALSQVEASDLNSLYDFASLELLKTGRFSLIERNAIDAILKEQEFGVSGVVDPSTAARIGKILGADAVMLTQISRVERDEFFKDEDAYEAIVFVRLIDSSTGEILYYGRGCGSGFGGKLEALVDAVGNALKPLKKKGGIQ